MQIAGKYGKAEVHSRNLDGKCAEEIRNICDMPFTGRWNMQVMPDQHYVSDYCVNGLTTDFGDTLMPEMLGFDMGCGMLVMKLKEREADLDKLHLSVLRSVPFAPMSRHTPNQKALALPWNELIVQSMIHHFGTGLLDSTCLVPLLIPFLHLLCKLSIKKGPPYWQSLQRQAHFRKLPLLPQMRFAGFSFHVSL